MLENIDYTSKEAMMNAIKSAADYINKRIDCKPDLAIVLGSGLGAFADCLSESVVIDYQDIPYFPKPTVQGHGGKLFAGHIEGKYVLVMQGRNHYYEGYDTSTITLPVRIFAYMGIDRIILTNACGGVNEHFAPGDLMIIKDHLAHFCPSPLRGAHLDELGPRFVDMSKAYHPELISVAERAAKDLKMHIQKGVYGYWPGPTYETAAEVLAYSRLGADVVGMSTVAETQVANSCGMKVLGISCITNMTCLISKGETNHQEVVDMGLKVADDFIRLIRKTISLL